MIDRADDEVDEATGAGDPCEHGGHLDLKKNAASRRRMANDLERRIVPGGEYETFDRELVAKLREDADAMERKAARGLLLVPGSRPCGKPRGQRREAQ